MTVQILPGRTHLGSQLGQALGQGFQKGAEQGIQRGQLQNALSQFENIQPGTTPVQLASKLMQATAGIPGAERYVGQLFPILLQQMQAQNSQNAPLPGEVTGQGQMQGQEQGFTSQGLPSFGQNQQMQQRGSQQQGASQNVPGQPQEGLDIQQGRVNVPLPATSGVIQQVLSPTEMIPASKKLAKQMTESGNPTTVAQAHQLIKEDNDLKILHNQQIEGETQKRVAAQRDYGAIAEEQLTEIVPDASPETRAIFKKIGENAASIPGSSEADIDKIMAAEVRKYKNTISNIKSDMGAERFNNKYLRMLKGTHKEKQQAVKDLQVKMKPLLDLGLFDLSRNLLSDLGYYPEERESVINPLNQKSNAVLNLVPDISRKYKQSISGLKIPVNEEINPLNHTRNVTSGLKELFEQDPNFSLVLARKAFEDKGYDWRMFKDSLNELASIPPEEGGINLNADQRSQLIYLDTPPLDRLDKILEGLNFIGR